MSGHLVEGHGEAPVYVVAMEHGYPHDKTDKVQPRDMVVIDGVSVHLQRLQLSICLSK